MVNLKWVLNRTQWWRLRMKQIVWLWRCKVEASYVLSVEKMSAQSQQGGIMLGMFIRKTDPIFALRLSVGPGFYLWGTCKDTCRECIGKNETSFVILSCYLWPEGPSTAACQDCASEKEACKVLWACLQGSFPYKPGDVGPPKSETWPPEARVQCTIRKQWN